MTTATVRNNDSGRSNTPVSVLGLGMLGSPLAGAFRARGHPTTVWNRSPGKADRLLARSAVEAATAGEAVEASPPIVVCVSDYAAACVILDAAGAVRRGRVVVNLSSGTLAAAREMAEWTARCSADYLDGAAKSGTRLVGRPEALFLVSRSADAGRPRRRPHLGADPGLAPLHDTALLGMAWDALAGFYHAIALMGTANVAAADFAAVATGHVPFLTRLMTDHARQTVATAEGWRAEEEGRYPDDDGTVEVHATAVDHLIHTSRTQGIGVALPTLIRSILETGIAAGHGAEGIASLRGGGVRRRSCFPPIRADGSRTACQGCRAGRSASNPKQWWRPLASQP